ncbi:MAG TPA: hypothetical protein VLH37_04660 [Bacteroidales bacterium]|nr:hypothetical protein [Bacteroidales bacterium]
MAKMIFPRMFFRNYLSGIKGFVSLVALAIVLFGAENLSVQWEFAGRNDIPECSTGMFTSKSYVLAQGVLPVSAVSFPNQNNLIRIISRNSQSENTGNLPMLWFRAIISQPSDGQQLAFRQQHFHIPSYGLKAKIFPFHEYL